MISMPCLLITCGCLLKIKLVNKGVFIYSAIFMFMGGEGANNYILDSMLKLM
jgi:hypothetical protein